MGLERVGVCGEGKSRGGVGRNGVEWRGHRGQE